MIARHDVTFRTSDWFHGFVADESLSARKLLAFGVGRAGNLFSLHLTAKNVYFAGSVIDPTNPAVIDAIEYAAEALTCLAGIQTAAGPNFTFQIGPTPPVTVPTQGGEKFLDMVMWRRATQLALIARRHDLLARLYALDTEAIGRACDLSDPDELHFVELAKQLWRGPDFAVTPTLERCEAILAANASLPGDNGKYVRGVSTPYLVAVRALAGGDRAAVAEAFRLALLAHKKYWSSSRRLREDLAGFVSLGLTSLAALAHDRGIAVDAESDYLPRAWVTGEVFRTPPTEVSAT